MLDDLPTEGEGRPFGVGGLAIREDLGGGSVEAGEVRSLDEKAAADGLDDVLVGDGLDLDEAQIFFCREDG